MNAIVILTLAFAILGYFTIFELDRLQSQIKD